MRIERLEIAGFKSFADPVTLEFGRGATAVVGPNGCGKSNIADAVFWVLGELGAGTIRARGKELIFSGSALREPLAVAEVRLHVSGARGSRPEESENGVARNGAEAVAGSGGSPVGDTPEGTPGNGAAAHPVLEDGAAGGFRHTVVVLTLGAVLAWRAAMPIGPRPRTVAGFALAVLALLWIALASRQLIPFSDPQLHLGMASAFQAGGFPPELSWSPGEPIRYHHGAQLLFGLLRPAVGPDVAFVAEMLGAFAWTSFVLVVVTALVARGSWQVALLHSPLLLATGLWTGTTVGSGILQAPFPAGFPEAGLRASLADTYWPSVGQSWSHVEAVLPNIWKPSFLLAYALALVVLERAARPGSRRS